MAINFRNERRRLIKRKIIFLFLVALLFSKDSWAQYPPFTKWYQNPLGFKPLNLHTANGIIIPAVAATVCLLLTKKDPAIVNKFSYFNENGFSYGYIPPYTTIYQNNTGMLFHARRWLAIGAELTVYGAWDNINNTWGIGIRPFVRFYPVHGDQFRLYFESGAGIIAFQQEFPKPSGFFGDYRSGTHFNGSPKYGIGAEVSLNKSFSIQFGIRHLHISNGNIWGSDQNPGHDSNGFCLGFLYCPNKGDL